MKVLWCFSVTYPFLTYYVTAAIEKWSRQMLDVGNISEMYSPIGYHWWCEFVKNAE
jgi:hypothetical protein